MDAVPTLVDLLGDTRAQVVELLRRGAASVADVADELGVTEVAARRHLQVLERDGLVEARTVRRSGRGRPGAQYRLTAKAQRLFPDRSAELANDALEYLEAEHGRSALRGFLQWRADRQEFRYAAALAAAGDDPTARAQALAALLSEDGFMAEVARDGDGDGVRLTQGHCAVRAVAEAHPELCAYEAALFQRVLGAKVSRRETIAGGADACVCHINEKKS